MNNVSLSGNLTETPELRSTQSGKQVCNFTVAINESKDKTEYVRCVAWEKTAELIGQYTKKGDRMACVGRLQTTKYTDGNGIEKYKTEVVVQSFDFPPKRSEKSDEENPFTAVKEAIQKAPELEDEIPWK